MATGTLTGTTIAATYKSILKVKGGANNVLDADPQLIEDGDGNDSVLGISTDSVLISGSGTRLDFNTDGSGEYISGDGTDLTIAAGTALNITADVIDLSDATKDVTLNAAVDALNFDSNTLSIDASNNRVGIGTASPGSPLDVESGEAANTAIFNSTNGATNISLKSSGTLIGQLEFTSGGDCAILTRTANASLALGSNNSKTLYITDDDNVGIGITPNSNWHDTYSALQIGAIGSISSQTASNAGNNFTLYNNAYRDSVDTVPERIVTGYASSYSQSAGVHSFDVAVSDDAGEDITWINAMTIASDGDITVPNDIDVDGTANLDNTDIDGTLDVNGIVSFGGVWCMQYIGSKGIAASAATDVLKWDGQTNDYGSATIRIQVTDTAAPSGVQNTILSLVWQTSASAVLRKDLSTVNDHGVFAGGSGSVAWSSGESGNDITIVATESNGDSLTAYVFVEWRNSQSSDNWSIPA